MENRTVKCIFCKQPFRSAGGPMISLVCPVCCSKMMINRVRAINSSASQNTGKQTESEDDFFIPYHIKLRRTKSERYGNSVTFIHLGFARPRPLSDDSFCVFSENKRRFEIPVFITDNKGKEFEGVLTGISDGNNISIVWEPDTSQKTLGVIIKTTNDTVRFEERRGATDNW